MHNLENINEPDARGSKIVNGLTSTTFNQFPYQCLIFITRPTATVQCGASLISGIFKIKKLNKSLFNFNSTNIN